LTNDRKEIVILGIGNTLYADDGFGPRASEICAGRFAERDDVDVVDAGPIGIDLIEYLTDYRRVVIVDAAVMGLAPGTIRVFTPDEVRSAEKGANLSLHSTDILGVIELAKALEKPIADVHVVAVEPKVLEPREGLSEAVAAALPFAVDEVEGLTRPR
jgi:hydrogenase maturation protease